ncbi:MAG: hypothetical protein MJK12_14330 [Colwellia sp.]|nr:hypothetical protein [Colwellia sp.]
MSHININQLDADMKIVGKNENPTDGKEYLYTIIQNNNLFLLMQSPKTIRFVNGKAIPITGEKYRYNQLQLPLPSLPWLTDSIENRFWKKASEGGLANDVLHVNEIVAEEDLLLRFSPNCRAEGVQGFTLKNYSKPDTQAGDKYTYMDLPYSLLIEGGLLDAWKKIIQDEHLPLIKGVAFKS